LFPRIPVGQRLRGCPKNSGYISSLANVIFIFRVKFCDENDLIFLNLRSIKIRKVAQDKEVSN